MAVVLNLQSRKDEGDVITPEITGSDSERLLLYLWTGYNDGPGRTISSADLEGESYTQAATYAHAFSWLVSTFNIRHGHGYLLDADIPDGANKTFNTAWSGSMTIDSSGICAQFSGVDQINPIANFSDHTDPELNFTGGSGTHILDVEEGDAVVFLCFHSPFTLTLGGDWAGTLIQDNVSLGVGRMTCGVDLITADNSTYDLDLTCQDDNGSVAFVVKAAKAFGDLIKSDITSPVTTATIVADLGSAPAAGNLLVVAAASNFDESISSPPSGFIELTSSIDGPEGEWIWWYKIAVGDEQTVSITWSGTTQNHQQTYAEYMWDGSTPTIYTNENVDNINNPTNSQPSGAVTPDGPVNIVIAVHFTDSGFDSSSGQAVDGSWIEDTLFEEVGGASSKFSHLVNVIGSQEATHSDSDAGDDMYGAIASFRVGIPAFGDIVNNPEVDVAFDAATSVVNITLAESPTAGNLGIFCHGTGAIDSQLPTDDGTGVWIEGSVATNTANEDQAVIYYKILAGDETVITGHSGTSDEHTASFMEVRGPWTINPLGQIDDVGETTDDSIDCGSVTTTLPVTFIVALGYWRTGTAGTQAVDSGFVKRVDQVSSTAKSMTVTSKLLSADGTETPIITIGSGSNEHIGCIAVFRGDRVTGAPALEHRSVLASETSPLVHTTASFTPPDNSLLVAHCMVANGDGAADVQTGMTLSGGGLVWTLRIGPNGGTTGGGPFTSCHEVWTAPVVSGASMTLTYEHAGDVGDNSSNAFIQVHSFKSNFGIPKTNGIANGAHDQGDGAVNITLDQTPLLSSVLSASRAYFSNGGDGNATVGSGWQEVYDVTGITNGDGSMQSQVLNETESTDVDWVDVMEASETAWLSSAMGIELILGVEAPILIGTENIAWGQNQSPTPQNITIPSDCTAVYMLWAYWRNPSDGSGLDTATLNSLSFNEAVEIGTDLEPATGIAAWYNPSTGSQELDISWDINITEGPNCIIAYVKGGSTVGWQGAGADQSENADPISITLNSALTNLVLKFDSKDNFGNPPGVSSGETSQATQLEGGDHARLSSVDVPGDPTTTVDAEDTAFSGLTAVSIPLAAAPAGGGTKTFTKRFTRLGQMGLAAILYGDFGLKAAADLITSTISIAFTVTPDLKGKGVLTSAISTVFTVTPDLKGVGVLSSTIANAFTLTADLKGVGVLSSTIPGVFTVTPDLKGIGVLSSTIPGVFTITGGVTAAASNDITSTIPITFSLTAALTGVGSLSSTIPAVFTVTPDLTGVGTLASTIASIFTVTTDLKGVGVLSSTIPAVFTLTADLKGIGVLSSTIPAVFTVSGTLADAADLVSSISIVFDLTADLKGVGVLASTIPAVFTVTSDLTGIGSLDSTIPIVFTVTPNLTGVGTVSSTIPIVFTFGGNLTEAGDNQLNSTIAIAFTVTPDLKGKGVLTSAIPAVLTLVPDLKGIGSLSSTIPAVLTITPDLKGVGVLSSTIPGVFTLTADLEGEGVLSTTIPITFTLTANLTGVGSLSSSIPAVFTITPDLKGVGVLASTIPGVFTLVGTPAVPQNINTTIPITFALAGTLTGIGQISGSITINFILTGDVLEEQIFEWKEVCPIPSDFSNVIDATDIWDAVAKDDTTWTEESSDPIDTKRCA